MIIVSINFLNSGGHFKQGKLLKVKNFTIKEITLLIQLSILTNLEFGRGIFKYMYIYNTSNFKFFE